MAHLINKHISHISEKKEQDRLNYRTIMKKMRKDGNVNI